MSDKQIFYSIALGVVIGLLFWALNGRFYLKVGPLELTVPHPKNWTESNSQKEKP